MYLVCQSSQDADTRAELGANKQDYTFCARLETPLCPSTFSCVHKSGQVMWTADKEDTSNIFFFFFI